MKFNDFVDFIIMNQPKLYVDGREFNYTSFSLPYNVNRKIQLTLNYNNVYNLCNIFVTINKSKEDICHFQFKKYIKIPLINVNEYDVKLIKAYKELVKYTLYFERIAISIDIVNALVKEKTNNSTEMEFVKMEFQHLFNIDNNLYFKFSMPKKISSFSTSNKNNIIDESFFDHYNKLNNENGVYYWFKCIELLYNEITCLSDS